MRIIKICRWGLFLALLAFTAALAVGYRSIPHKIATGGISPPDDLLEEITRSLRQTDPETANELQRIEDRRRRNALAAVIRAESERPEGRVSQRVEHLTRSPDQEWDYRLAYAALDPERFNNQDQQREFLLAHGTTLGVLNTPEATTRYLVSLDRSMQDANQWAIVRTDPLAMLVFEQVSNPQLQEFYLREKSNSDWLDELILELMPSGGADSEVGQELVTVEKLLRVANSFHPLFKNAVVGQHKIDPFIAYALFEHYGNAIQIANSKGGIPLDQLLEVLLANDDLCDDLLKTKDAQNLAAYVIQIYTERPSVWNEARLTPLALRLDRDAPAYADQVLQQYGEMDIAALLYSGYEDEIPNAAASVEKFGDLAILLLSRYAEEPFDATTGQQKFHDSLRKLGPRVIPYTARFDDAGLERLQENQAWLDKNFHEDGTPKEEEWWTALPGGAVMKVAKNYAGGYPNEWGELGWAAVDVADAALLVATMGSSKVATESVKQGAKQGAKRVVVGNTRRKAANLPGVRGASPARQSLLKQLTTRGVTLFPASRWMSPVWRTLALVNKSVSTAGRAVLAPARTLHTAWKGSDPRTKRLVYRALLATGLFATLTQRTIPKLLDVGKAVEAFVRDVTEKLVTLPAEALNKTVEYVRNWAPPRYAAWIGWGVWGAALLLSVGLTYWAFPRRRKVRYV